MGVAFGREAVGVAFVKGDCGCGFLGGSLWVGLWGMKTVGVAFGKGDWVWLWKQGLWIESAILHLHIVQLMCFH